MIERVIQKELNIYRNRSSFVKERKREMNDFFEVAACMKIMTEKNYLPLCFHLYCRKEHLFLQSLYEWRNLS